VAPAYKAKATMSIFYVLEVAAKAMAAATIDVINKVHAIRTHNRLPPTCIHPLRTI
jgi:hypothetical protein